MKKTKLSGIAAASILMLTLLMLTFLTGCQQTNKTLNNTSAEPAVTNETAAVDILEKRGFKTNISDAKELVVRASKIASFKYNITDDGISNEEYRFYVLSRFIKIQLPELRQHETGELYDEIFLDRLTKTAFSHCGKASCPRPNIDNEIEKVDYDQYHMNDPMEYLYKAIRPEFIKEEMIGDQYTKVFKTTFEGNEARIWLQEYYGFPVKIIVKNPDGSKRKITFENMMIDATRRGEIDLPFNFTVKGEGEKTWLFWEHYLGEWPKTGTVIKPGETVDLGV